MAENNRMTLVQVADDVWKTEGARIIDRSGRRRLAIGDDGFVTAAATGTLVDKTMLIADVLDSGYKATLFCRPRRFGKTLNMTMLKAFFEAPDAAGLTRQQAEALFAGTEVWEAKAGEYRAYQGAYPVVHLSLSTAVGGSWDDCYATIQDAMAVEYLRHGYLRDSHKLPPEDKDFFNAIASKQASAVDLSISLAALCRMLRAHHGSYVIVLIDEYDAPVMSGHTHGYYDQVVSFMRRWLTGALKDGGAALAFACLTGVQRISKESIFSGLNNIYVSTSLGTDFDERYGFTDAEVQTLATYLGHPDCMEEARAWYDGYRFGKVDVYNPWSVLNYLAQGCTPDVYWGNTSGNSVVGELVANADADTLEEVYSLLEPHGVVEETLDLGVVFPELELHETAMWSLLYLAGYLTTNDTEIPNDDMRLRRLRIPNHEVRRLYRNEVIRRFRAQAGGAARLAKLHRALLAGDEPAFAAALGQATLRASSLDLTAELPCHMLLMGLLFGVSGYQDPISNREEGYGRYDIRLEPSRAGMTGPRPLVTLELKYLKPADAPQDETEFEDRMHGLAAKALEQIDRNAYDANLPAGAVGRLRWGVAFCGKRVAVACSHV